jgi:hypothetical protein
MRLMNNYAYANPFLRPVSLDALAVPDPDDFAVLSHPVEDPAVDIEHDLELTRIKARSGYFSEPSATGTARSSFGSIGSRRPQAAVAKRMRISAAAVSKRLSRVEAKGRTALAALRYNVVMQ